MTLEIYDSTVSLRKRLDSLRQAGKSIGFVPTMGYLHEGHGSLIAAAKRDNDVVVLSIFVNPLQFAADEDLATYPKDLERDLALAQAHGASILFTPSVEEIYPDNGNLSTKIKIDALSKKLEGKTRPTHFSGVATVVCKLLNIIGFCKAYFGEKDYQQLIVIQTMVSDLSIQTRIVGCPIVRNLDGLALSSRNSYLSVEEKKVALKLFESLTATEELFKSGQKNTQTLINIAISKLEHSFIKIDYVEIVDVYSLDPLNHIETQGRLLIACWLGKTRLIDNCLLSDSN